MAIGDVDAAPAGSPLSVLSRDFERLRTQKSHRSGGVESRILTNLAFYHGEHYVRMAGNQLIAPPLDKSKLFLVFNLVRKLAKQRIGRLNALSPDFGAKPSKADARSYAMAEVVDKLIDALDQKVVQSSRSWELYWWLVIAGVAIEHVPWVPNASVEPAPLMDPQTGEPVFRMAQTDTQVPESVAQAMIQRGDAPASAFSPAESLRPMGDVGSTIISPLAFFIDASVRSIRDLQPGQRCYLAEIKTIEWIRETFGEDMAAQARSRSADLSILKTRLNQRGPTLSGTHLRDLLPAVQGTHGKDDPDMALFVTAYEPPSEMFPTGRESFFVPNRVLLNDRPNPYEEIPLVDYHAEPTATSFWSMDFMTDLIPGQKFFNKRMSQLGEQANASIYDLLLLGPDLKAVDLPTDYPGVVEDGIDQNGNPQVVRVPGPSLPSWFLESIRLIIEFLQTTGASTLLQSLGANGAGTQRRGVTDIPLLQEIIDSEDGPIFQHLGTQLATVKQMRVNRVKQFYPPLRTLNYTGSGSRDEVLVFHTSQILRAGVDFTVTVDRSTLVPELHAIRAARVNQELSGPMAILYVNPRTGQLDPRLIARALKYGETEATKDRLTQGIKYEQEAISRMVRNEDPPPVYPFHPHDIMMDELEAHMTTTEFAASEPTVQQRFFQRWQEHQSYLAQQAQQAQDAANQAAIQQAIAQGTQQVAAQVAGQMSVAGAEQILAQANAAQANPVEPQVQAAIEGASRGPEAPPV